MIDICLYFPLFLQHKDEHEVTDIMEYFIVYQLYLFGKM